MPRREVDPQRLLANVALFKQLDVATRARIAARARRMPLRRGAAVFKRGEEPAGFFVVVYGEIALTTHGGRGPRLSGTVGAGRSFGEPMMFLARPYIADARAQTDTLLLFVPQEAVFDEIERNAAFARRLLAGLAARIETLVREFDRYVASSAQQRLVAYLLRAAGTRSGAATVTLPASKAAVASQLGLTPEHFSRILHDLGRRRLLRIERRRIIIDDVRALAATDRA